MKPRAVLVFLAFLGMVLPAPGAVVVRKALSGDYLAPAAARLTIIGRVPATNQLFLALGLPLRNEGALKELLGELQDPRSPAYHKYVDPEQFAARFGPTQQEVQAAIDFVEGHGLSVLDLHSNRMVLDVEGSVSNIERAFQITLNTYRHPTESRVFYAPDRAPSMPSNVTVLEVAGLTDFWRPRPLHHWAKAPTLRPLGGSGPSGYLCRQRFSTRLCPRDESHGCWSDSRVGRVLRLLSSGYNQL